MPIYVEDIKPDRLGNTAARIYRRQCRGCGDPFDSLVHWRATCVPCQEGRVAPAAEKLVAIQHVTYVEPPKGWRPKASKNNGVTYKRDRAHRTANDDPRVIEIIERAIECVGSVSGLEKELGLAENQIRSHYRRGRSVPIGVMDELLVLLGEPHRLDEFFA